ncbi:MAG: folate family ECF transporter S component [Lactobacillales bacterium]|jgi:ECF transporter S component (folate family)|nr:folate family ECF transporter S component [Lactobacillales bacterium]
MKKIFTTRAIVVMAVLTAMDVIFTHLLAINTQFLRISFNFIIHSILGALFGPIGAAISMFFADVLGANLFPNGPFFIGFSLNAIVMGLLYGFFYYKKEITWARVITATLVTTLLSSLILTPMWLTIMYKVPFWSLMPIRLVKSLILVPIQAIVTYYVLPQIMRTPEFKRFQHMQQSK